LTARGAEMIRMTDAKTKITSWIVGDEFDVIF